MAAYSARSRDIRLAAERIGNTVDKRCRWLLDEFAPRDPDTMTSAERLMLRDHLQALSIHRWRHIDAETDLPPDPPGHVALLLNEPADEALRGLWQDVVALTRIDVNAFPVPLPDTGDGLWIQRTSNKGWVAFGRCRLRGDFRAVLLHHVADLLVACKRLRVCPECHGLFVAQRRQERHAACARQARDRRRNLKRRRT